MTQTILVTGATDGIGLATAHTLVEQGHTVLLHGRNAAKLAATEKALSALPGAGRIESYLADLSRMADVTALARNIAQKHERLDVLINNAGIYRAPETITADGLDVRFAVNTLAPYLLTQRLLPLLGAGARVVNLSSAAQAPVESRRFGGSTPLADMAAYAQSKLALTMWSRHLALALEPNGPVIVAVNPGSLLATKMVKEGFGVAGSDIRIGADILVRAALSDEFASANGLYFDNDARQFGAPHPDGLNAEKLNLLVQAIDAILASVQK